MSHWMKSISLFWVIMLVAAAGCSSGSNTAAPAETKSNESAAAVAGTIRTFEDAMGTVDIPGTPVRIVSLDWVYTEELITLGIQPVGAASTEQYRRLYGSNPELAVDVKDVGERQEPNLEVLAALKPDLIISNLFFSKTNYESLKGIAPTLLFNPYPDQGQINQYEEMEQSFRTIAEIVGKQEEAEQVLADLQRTYGEAKDKLKAAGQDGAPFVLSQLFPGQGGANLRLMTDNSTAVQTLQRIGLNNAYQPGKFEQYGFSQTNVEALTPIQDANFFYVPSEDSGAIEKQLAENALWKGLEFVKEQRNYSLGSDAWLFGGPLSAMELANRIVRVLAP